MLDRLSFAYWYGLRFTQTFAANVGRRNDYYWPGRRAGLFLTCAVAHIIARTCAEIRTGRAHDQLPEGQHA